MIEQSLSEGRIVSGAMEVEDGVTALDQVGEGFNFNLLTRLHFYYRWEQWYKNQYNTLFRQAPSLVNGLTLVDLHDLVSLPVFPVTSKYYQDTILAKKPLVQSQKPEVQGLGEGELH